MVLVMEVHRSPGGATFTWVVLITPGALSCVRLCSRDWWPRQPQQDSVFVLSFRDARESSSKLSELVGSVGVGAGHGAFRNQLVT